MPIERIIQLGLFACAMMAGLFLLPSNAVEPVGGLWLSFGLTIILLHRLLGGLDFKISGFLLYSMSVGGMALQMILRRPGGFI